MRLPARVLPGGLRPGAWGDCLAPAVGMAARICTELQVDIHFIPLHRASPILSEFRHVFLHELQMRVDAHQNGNLRRARPPASVARRAQARLLLWVPPHRLVTTPGMSPGGVLFHAGVGVRRVCRRCDGIIQCPRGSPGSPPPPWSHS